MVEPIASYHDVHKSFGDVDVLKGIDLEIAPAEKVALIGPSGSGKTTIIRMLMTLEQPTSGIIEIDGNNLWHMEKDNELIPANEKYLRRCSWRYRHGLSTFQFVSTYDCFRKLHDGSNSCEKGR